jgi:hypothetical protein
MTRLHPVVVVHYHEISLKRGNRPLFLRQLARNLARAVADVGPVNVRQRPGRIVLDLEGHAQPEVVLERARRVCGVASVLLGYRTAATLEAMRAVIGGLIEGRRFASFRITARRAFKTYPMTSVELTAPSAPSCWNAWSRAWTWSTPRSRSSWRCYRTRRSSPWIAGRARGACRSGAAVPWRRCSRAASTRRWRPGG